MRDELSVYFENPAEDAMGYEHVDGRLFCGKDTVELQYKQRDRAFKKNDPQVVAFSYDEVAGVEYRAGWFKQAILVFQSRDAEKLSGFPGAEVGKVELQVTRESKKDAKKAADFIEYRQSEAYLRESHTRLEESRDEFGGEI